MPRPIIPPARSPPQQAIPDQSPSATRLGTAQHGLAVHLGGPVDAGRETLLAQQLALEQAQFERLKHDFTYNLSLLRERDAELEKYDVDNAAMRETVEQHASANARLKDEMKEYERRALTEFRRSSELEIQVAEAARLRRGFEEAAERAEAEAHRLSQELDAARAHRADAELNASRAQTEAHERGQEVAAVRNELQMRIQMLQRQQAEAEDGWRAALAEERSAIESRHRTERADSARQIKAMVDQNERHQVELAEAVRAHEMAVDEARALREAQANEALRLQKHREERARSAAALDERQQEARALPSPPSPPQAASAAAAPTLTSTWPRPPRSRPGPLPRQEAGEV